MMQSKVKQTEEEREASRAAFRTIVDKVLPLATRIKKAMEAKKIVRARILCPEHPKDGEPKYIWASLNERRNHLHMACEDSTCTMRFME